jgi:hypothetical protein
MWYGGSSFDITVQTTHHYYTQLVHAGLKHRLESWYGTVYGRLFAATLLSLTAVINNHLVPLAPTYKCQFFLAYLIFARNRWGGVNILRMRTPPANATFGSPV